MHLRYLPAAFTLQHSPSSVLGALTSATSPTVLPGHPSHHRIQTSSLQRYPGAYRDHSCKPAAGLSWSTSAPLHPLHGSARLYRQKAHTPGLRACCFPLPTSPRPHVPASPGAQRDLLRRAPVPGRWLGAAGRAAAVGVQEGGHRGGRAGAAFCLRCVWVWAAAMGVGGVFNRVPWGPTP